MLLALLLSDDAIFQEKGRKYHRVWCGTSRAARRDESMCLLTYMCVCGIIVHGTPSYIYIYKYKKAVPVYIL